MIFEKNGIIAAVKGDDGLSEALKSKCDNIFLLHANINSAEEDVERCHRAGKRVFIHIDLAEGFGKDEAGITYIFRRVKPDGILSTKNNIIKMARDTGLFCIYRIFLIDAQSMESALANIGKLRPDAVELMPGIAYEAIAELCERADVDVIAGGFVRTFESAEKAFEAGAAAVSTSNIKLWN